MRAPIQHLTLALAVVVILALPARAQVPNRVGIDPVGPYPDLSAAEPVAPSGLRGDAGAHPFGSGPEPAASDIGGDPPRLPAADSVDLDGVFRYRFVGEHNGSRTGWDISFSDDVDCDGVVEVLVAAPSFTRPGGRSPGAVYIVSMADVAAADAADGAADGVIDLGLVAAQPRSWKLTSEGLLYVGTSVASGDVDADGCSDLLVGARALDSFAGSAYVVSGADLPAGDASDGALDGVVDIRRIADRPGSWELTGEAAFDDAGRTVLFAGDMNADGRADLLISAPFHGEDDRGAAYLLSGAALASADAADGAADGRIALASVAAQPDSWKLVGEHAKGLAGIRMAVANLDADGRPDLILAADAQFEDDDDTTGLDAEGSLYFIAGADLRAMDTADKQSDGVIGIDAVARGGASWKLVGDFDDQLVRSYGVAAGDVDGDGVDNVFMSNFATDSLDRYPAEVFAISVSDLPAADAADGTEDRVVALGSTLEQDDSFKLVWGRASAIDVASNLDIDGDGLDDLLIGNDAVREVSRCGPDGGVQLNGAVALLPGGGLHAADAGDGVADSVIDLHRLPLGDGFWKFIGGPTDRLGTKVGAGDIDGDGRDDPLLASFLPLTPYRDCGSGVGKGYVFMMSSSDMATADALDGETDGAIHLEALQVPWEAANEPLVFRQFDDSVIVVGAPELDYGVSVDTLIKAFLRSYGDVVDFLVVVTDPRVGGRQSGSYAGVYGDVRNSVAGIGKGRFGSRVYGERLKGFIHVPLFNPFHFPRTLQHEIVHAWANFIIASGRPHWGFSSANGVLGGFDSGQLVEIGDGRYTAGRFDPMGNDLPYSPIELYLAGLIPPDEVPVLWVANDGAWSDDVDASGNRVFTASDTEAWSIERVIEEHGARTPSWLDSQKSFRAATMLIVDDPAQSRNIARELSEALRTFSVPGPDGDDDSYNFWEATGGRATLTTDGLASESVPRLRQPFTDHPIVPGETPVRAVHFTELRTRIDGLRSAVGLGRFPWTDPVLRASVTRIRIVHLLELRSALAAAYTAAGRSTPSWTDAGAVSGATPIRAAHLMELRAAVVTLE